MVSLTLPAIMCHSQVQALFNDTTVKFHEHLVAGSIARVVGQTLLHPLDVIRTRRQVPSLSSLLSLSFLRSRVPAFPLSSRRQGS